MQGGCLSDYDAYNTLGTTLYVDFVPHSGLHYTYPRDRQRIARLEDDSAAATVLTPDPERQRLWSAGNADVEVRERTLAPC